MSLLRKALKEAGLGEDAIETVPKRGYRLTINPAPAREAETAPESAAAPSSAAAALSPPAAPTRRQWSGALVAALAVLVLGAAAAIYLLRGDAQQSASATSVVAVLPFDALSPNADHGWFADGLADELIDNLSRVPGLVVIGRTSSFQFRRTNLDAREIGEKLGARHPRAASVTA